jgi:phosphoribosylaminoimidazolecarboxamide formyltransferase / IMP cyclohydrolase
MRKKIKSALISVYYKDGLEELLKTLNDHYVVIYSTGGTKDFIEKLNIPCIAAEQVTGYPSILGGRVKTLHPVIFGGILGKREDTVHQQQMQQYNIPEIDLVIVDLYPFEETVKSTTEEELIIEKIDIGGPSMLRAAAKNHKDVAVISRKDDYDFVNDLLQKNKGALSLEERRHLAIRAFDTCTGYDIAISNYFNHTSFNNPFQLQKRPLRYGENPHQQAVFYGNLHECFEQLNGKELSYNNLVDVDAAMLLMNDLDRHIKLSGGGSAFAIIKHTNVCGVAMKDIVLNSWQAAIQGDPESAFGGILISNGEIDAATAKEISELFFEVLIAPSFSAEALELLKAKKNRILLQYKTLHAAAKSTRGLLTGVLEQDTDIAPVEQWEEAGGRPCTESEKADLQFANIIAKHLKSNAIALVKDNQLLGKGCGQTSRIDALRQSIDKARQFNFDLHGAVLASDAFFPFDDCVRIAHAEGITAFIQPGGSIRDKDSIEYCKQNGLAMVITGVRHFKH